jgi:hypothetical protein
MDEYARIFRLDVWLNPPIAPSVTDRKILVIKMFVLNSGIMYSSTDMGATFCQVRIKSRSVYFSPSVTGGIQK